MARLRRAPQCFGRGAAPGPTLPSLSFSRSTLAPQAILTGLKLSGRVEGSKAGQRMWGSWQQLLRLAGLAGVPQVLWATFQPASTSLLPCQLTLAAGCAVMALEAAGRLPRRVQGLWTAASAWTATALFMLQPVSQLVVNFTVRVWRGGVGCDAALLRRLKADVLALAQPERSPPAPPPPRRTPPACRACRWPPFCWRRAAMRSWCRARCGRATGSGSPDPCGAHSSLAGPSC